MRLFSRSVALILVALLSSVVVFGYGQASGPQVDLPTVLTTVAVGTGSSADKNGPTGVGVDTVTNRIFVANSRDNAIYVVNGNNNTVIGTITHAAINNPQGVAVNSVSRKVYVANAGSNSVLVLDADAMTVSKEITGLGASPNAIAIDTGTNMVYVTDFNSSYDTAVSIINGASDVLYTNVTLGFQFAYGIALDTAQHRAYITHRFGGCPMYISVLDIQTLAVSQYDGYPMCEPAGLVVRPAASSVFVAQRYNGDNGGRPDGNPALSIFNYVGGLYTKLVKWDVGLRLTLDGTNFYHNPVGIAYNPTTERVFVNSYGDSAVVVVDAINLTVLTALPVGSNPDMGVAVNPVTSMVYVANRSSGTLTVIVDGTPLPTPTPTNTSTPTPIPCVADAYEPDNTPAQAKGIVPTFGYTQSHSFCGTSAPWETDEDWVSFAATAPVTLTMATSNLSGGADTILTLYGPDVVTTSTQLATDNDGGGGLASRIVYSFTSTGVYYLRVTSATPAATAAKLKAMGLNPAAALPQRNYDLAVTGGPPLNNRVYLPIVSRN